MTSQRVTAYLITRRGHVILQFHLFIEMCFILQFIYSVLHPKNYVVMSLVKWHARRAIKCQSFHASVCVWCRIQIQSVKYNRVFSQNLNLYLSNQEDVWWTLRTYLPKLYLCFLRNQRLGSITSAFKQTTCVLTFGEHCPHSPVTNRRH